MGLIFSNIYWLVWLCFVMVSRFPILLAENLCLISELRYAGRYSCLAC